MPINAIASFYVMYRIVGLFAAAAGMGAIVLESIPIQGNRVFSNLMFLFKNIKLENTLFKGVGLA